MKTKTIVIVLAVGIGYDRTDLEKIEGNTFESLDAIRDEFLDATPEAGQIGLYELSEFMDACNDMDSETPEHLKIKLGEVWIGYVNLKK